MAEAYYIIPMVPGPYSRENPQRPDYVDEICCGWTGHNVDELGIYVCKVNTTDIKQRDLASRPGVGQITGWNSRVSNLIQKEKDGLRNWCNKQNIPFDESETGGEFLQRVICWGLFSLSSTPLDTKHQNLTSKQKTKILNLSQKFGISHQSSDTVGQIVKKCGNIFWPGNNLRVEEF